MRPRTAHLLLVAFLAGTEAAHEWWLRADTLPQGWDQAALLTSAERFRRMGPVESCVRFPVSPGYYPPLVPWLASVSARVFGNTDDGFTRIMPVFRVLLVAATFRLARCWLSPGASLASAILLGTAPLVVRDTRHLTPDVPLAALTALAALLLAVAGLRTRAAALRFGAVAGLGLLVKWTLPLYLTAPLVGTVRSVRAARRHVIAAAVAAVAVCAGWYAVNLPHLVSGLGTAAYHGADIAGDRIVSLFSVLYYPSTLPATLGWPLTFSAAAGLIFAMRTPAWRRRLWMILVPLVLLILIRNKKERYFAPVHPFLAVLAGLAIDRVKHASTRARVVAAVAGLGLVQFASLTFPVPWSFGESCRPQVQDWPMEAIIRHVSDDGGGSLAVIPDLPALNIHMAEFQSARLGGAVRPSGIGDFPGTCDWALVTTGDQGPWHSTPEIRARLTRELLSASGSGALFRTVQRWNLPDGSTARLLRRRPLALDTPLVEPALRRAWRDRFAGTLRITQAGGDVILSGSPLTLRLAADGAIVPIRFRSLALVFAGATPYLQPDGTVELRCDRVIVQSLTLDPADLEAFLAAARPHWRHGDVRLVAKPVRSLLRRLEDPAFRLTGSTGTLTGRLRGSAFGMSLTFGVRDRRLTVRITACRWHGIPVPAQLLNAFHSGSLLATVYPLADRLEFPSLEIRDGRYVIPAR